MEFFAEQYDGAVDFALLNRKPEIELVSTRLTAVTIVDVPLEVYREYRITCICDGVLRKGTLSSPLIAAAGGRLESDEFQDPVDGDFPPEGSIVEGRHVRLV
jgi:hypothetical protein